MGDLISTRWVAGGGATEPDVRVAAAGCATTITRPAPARLDDEDVVRGERLRVRLREPGGVVHFQPQTVTERVAEEITQAARRDQPASQRVGAPRVHPRTHAGAGPLLRVVHQ